MKKSIIHCLTQLRCVVGYLGEKDQFGWWQSSFYSSQIGSFLTPVFPRTTQLAKYRGVSAAAQLVHDELVGKGSYHMYRLPFMWERSAAEVANGLDVSEFVSSSEAALHRLRELSDAGESREGPVTLGDFSDDFLEQFIAGAAGHYLRAFESDYRTYPYLRDLERTV